MEQVRDLNMDADDMQVVLSAISGVSKRIKEVAQTHKPLFGGEHILTGKEVCERLYISPRTLQDYRDRSIIPYTQFDTVSLSVSNRRHTKGTCRLRQVPRSL